MTIAKGTTATDIIGKALIDLSDPKQRRWSSDQMISYLNDGVADLASYGCFRRTDYLVGVVDQNCYEMFAEVVNIRDVYYNKQPVAADDYTFRANTVCLNTAPTYAGEAFTFVGTPTVDEDDAAKLKGDGQYGALNGGVVYHFLPGDGVVPDASDKKYNLWVSYSYYPRPLISSDTVPMDLELALRTYCCLRALSISEDEKDAAMAQVYLRQYNAARTKVIAHRDTNAKSDQQRFGAVKGV